ncbi:MAG: hypothetical protein R3266_00320 [Gemmatimonadota bacterium]|nr:hypothetical protein [Gemmatimonadota bacterium]
MTGLFFLGLAVLVILGGWAARRRVREARTTVTDEMVRRIERLGRVDAEDVEPLDLDEARAEEDAFWARTWDEPEEL